jgi:hypothetical protein
MRGFAATLGVLIVALLAVASAQAQGPSLTAVSVTGGQTRAVWTLPTNVRSQFAEVATNPEVNEFGYFRQRNLVSFDVLRRDQRSYTDDLKLLPGTYYIHIAGHDDGCSSCSPIEFSRIMRYTVSAAGTGTGTDAGPTPTKGKGDKTKPRPKLRFNRLQDVDRLSLRASMNERGTLAASATVTVTGGSAAKRYSFKGVTRTVTANKKVGLRLKLSAAALGSVKRALTHGQHLRARVRVTAVDASGNSRKKTVFIRLKP